MEGEEVEGESGFGDVERLVVMVVVVVGEGVRVDFLSGLLLLLLLLARLELRAVVSLPEVARSREGCGGGLGGEIVLEVLDFDLESFLDDDAAPVVVGSPPPPLPLFFLAESFLVDLARTDDDDLDNLSDERKLADN